MPIFKSREFKDADVDMQKRQITGYAATWDQDQVGDIIHKGAFKKTLNERKQSVKVMRNHSILIGKPLEMYEDSKGLVTISEIADTPHGEDALKLAKMGALDEMSIQFTIPQTKSEFDDSGLRHIHEVKLYEYGPVDFPANNAARITSVKSLQDQILDGARFSPSEIDELMIQLIEMKALLTNEPSKDTQTGQQPQELKALFDAINNFG